MLAYFKLPLTTARARRVDRDADATIAATAKSLAETAFAIAKRSEEQTQSFAAQLAAQSIELQECREDRAQFRVQFTAVEARLQECDRDRHELREMIEPLRLHAIGSAQPPAPPTRQGDS